MSGYLFPASTSSTTSSCTPWNLPGWQVASFLLFTAALSPPPFPMPDLPLWSAVCSVCFPDSLGPVPSGENSPWGLLISIVFPGCHSWHRFCWADRIWGLFVALSLNPLTERSSHVARQEWGWSDPGWQRQAYHHSDPDISGEGLGVGVLWECLDALRPTLREMWLFCFRLKDKWLGTKIPRSFGPCPASGFFKFLPCLPSPDRKKEKQDF